MMLDTIRRWQSPMLSILRIIVGLLFLEHGLMKLFHFPIAQVGAPNPLTPLFVAAGVIELVGGTLLTLGLFSRSVAFVGSGEMAAAYFMVHAPKSFWPGVNGGELAIFYCFSLFYFVCAGPGRWSLDVLLAGPALKQSEV